MNEKRMPSMNRAVLPEELLRDRLVLYVKTLRLPPQDGLKLVLRTMEEFAADSRASDLSGQAFLLSDMLESLRKRIMESGYEISLKEPGTPVSVPIYNRDRMPPAELRKPSAAAGRPLNRLPLGSTA